MAIWQNASGETLASALMTAVTGPLSVMPVLARKGLAFFAANAVTEFAAEYFVDAGNVCCKRSAGVGVVNTPDTPIVRIWVTLYETASFETIDDGAHCGATGAHLVSESGLGGGTELCDVGQEAGLREIEVEWLEPGVECLADQARRRHQRRLDPQPGRCVEFVVGQAAHGFLPDELVRLDTYCTTPYNLCQANHIARRQSTERLLVPGHRGHPTYHPLHQHPRWLRAIAFENVVVFIQRDVEHSHAVAAAYGLVQRLFELCAECSAIQKT